MAGMPGIGLQGIFGATIAAVHQQDVLQAYQNQLQEGQPHHGGCGRNLRFD
jgi:hypothetical protein